MVAVFCFNIHKIVQIRSLNLMFIRNVIGASSPFPGFFMIPG